MSMILPLLITFGILIGGWSFLSVLGNERQRQAQQRPPASPPAAPEAPVRDQVAR